MMKRTMMAAAVLAVAAIAGGDVLAQPGGDNDRRGPQRKDGPRGKGPRGPGRFGGPGGPGRFGGPGGPMGQPPKPGRILPEFLQNRLQLTAEQKKQLGALQKEVDTQLQKILTDAQKKQLKEFAERRGRFGRRGPGGFGPGGPGGPRGGFGPGGPGRGFGPGGPGRGGPGGKVGRGGPRDPAVVRAEAMIERMMQHDKNKDGKLSKDELPEAARLFFDRADTNRDGFLDKSELRQLIDGRGRRGGPDGRRPRDGKRIPQPRPERDGE
jgi:EF hand